MSLKCDKFILFHLSQSEISSHFLSTSVDEDEDCLSSLDEEHAHAHNLIVTPPADHRQVIVTPLLDHVGLADTVLNDAGSVKINAGPMSPPPPAAAPSRNGGISGIACK